MTDLDKDQNRKNDRTPAIAFVIPTRNRSDLVVRALESVYSQLSECPEATVIVSDNSTEDLQVNILAEHMQARDSAKVQLIRPPQPLNMTKHWQWAIGYALNNTQATHFAFLTDRMLLRPGQLAVLTQLCKANPSELISYTYDRINDASLPITFSPIPRSGLVYKLESANLLQRSSRLQFSSSLPRMLNSISPRAHLERLIERFGSVFASMSPDFCFCFRSLAITQNILYLDKSVLLNYAQFRSNGGSVSRGVKSKDYSDYLANSAEKECHLCPLPDIITIGNGITHEYCYVRAEVGENRLPAIDLPSYRYHLAGEVSAFADSGQRDAAVSILKEDGWKQPLLYGLQSVRRNLSKSILEAFHPRFSSLEKSLEYAINRPPTVWPWLHKFVRRYGRQIM